MKTDIINDLKIIIDYAYDNIPIYRNLYKTKPALEAIEGFKNLPYIRLSDFITCKIEDVISDVTEAISILPPIENKKIFPFPRLESSHDRDMRYESFRFLVKQIDVKEGASFLVLADSSHSYFCGEIVNNLLYYKYPTSMIFLRDHSDNDIRDWIDKLQPDYLVVGTKRLFRDIDRWNINNIVTLNQYNNAQKDNINHYDIYSITEIGWVGISKNSDDYIYPEEYFYIESDPRDDILIITTLAYDLLPFIRYKTTDKAKIIDYNRFHIKYIGEH